MEVGGGYPVASQIKPRCHLRATIRSYLLTPSFLARATLGSQSLGGAALQEGKSRRVVLASVGGLHLPADPVPPSRSKTSSSQSGGGGGGCAAEAGGRKQRTAPVSACSVVLESWYRRGDPRVSRGLSSPKPGRLWDAEPRAAPKCAPQRRGAGASGPPSDSSLLPSPNGGGEGYGDRGAHPPPALESPILRPTSCCPPPAAHRP